jgi:hypothetical protein
MRKINKKMGHFLKGIKFGKKQEVKKMGLPIAFGMS